jgi:hypothetical protein
MISRVLGLKKRCYGPRWLSWREQKRWRRLVEDLGRRKMPGNRQRVAKGLLSLSEVAIALIPPSGSEVSRGEGLGAAVASIDE